MADEKWNFNFLFFVVGHYHTLMSHFLSFYNLLRITLNTLTLNVKSDKVYTRHGVPISVTGIAQVCLENWMTEIPTVVSNYKSKLALLSVPQHVLDT